jgi:hypothetical protein
MIQSMTFWLAKSSHSPLSIRSARYQTMKTPEEQLQFLRENECQHPKILVDGRYAALQQFIYTCAILAFDDLNIDFGPSDRWCYENKDAALKALEAWDGTGEPQGWHRHPTTGRRRKNGDPATEYVSK